MKPLTITTWNVENLENNDSILWNARKPVLRKMLERTKADVLLLQEIHSVDALKDLIQGTHYANHFITHTTKQDGSPFAARNLVVLSVFPISEIKQYMNTLVDNPEWRKVTANPVETSKKIGWERPILHVIIDLASGKKLHVINLHLKSFPPTPINGQIDPNNRFRWMSHGGWSEGFLSHLSKDWGRHLRRDC